jgi:hypothetical protein
MASPSPVPPYLRVIEPSACSKAVNSRFWSSAAMPMPVSLTSIRSRSSSPPSSSTRTRSEMLPASVNLTALPARLSRICPSRSGSPLSCRRASSGVTSMCRPRPFSATLCPISADRLFSTSSSVKSTCSRLSRSASILEMSRMLLMTPSRWCEDWSILRSSWLRSRHPWCAACQAGHAHDGVHRRAQFVAHVGKEGALGATGGFRSLLGHRQRGGALLDHLFEVVAVPFELGFRPLAFGDVEQAADIVGRFPGHVANRGDG